MAEDTLVARVSRLDQLISQPRRGAAAASAGRAGKAPCLRSLQALAGREALLDALVALYDECNKDGLKQNALIAGFVNKFRGVVTELRRLRVGPADFEVRKTIGRGHFGQVHVVHERRSGDVFAMKTLRKQDTLAQTGVMFYEEERDIMTEAVSPWITALHYAFQDSRQLYLVMDFHPGGDLMALLDRFDGLLEEPTARFYLAEIALALHDLHNMGYVHRDVKPENVLLDRCGHVKLADFGSAARLGPSGLVSAGMPVGTPDYLAPEVLQTINQGPATPRKNSPKYGKGCDYWSLGVVAFEMLAGRTPFSDEKLGSTYTNIIEHKRHLVRPQDPPLGEAAWSLIQGLLTDDNRRLAHAQVLQHAFFTSVDWNNIRNTPPPFIPTVNGSDDTSNFDEVPPEPASPSLDSLLQQSKFSGRELPFIGFSYTKPLGEPRAKDRRSRSLLPAASEGSEEVERKLSEQRRQLHQLRERLQEHERGDVGLQLKQVTAKLKEKNERLQELESERLRLETELAKAEDKSAGYVRMIDMERKDRMTTEKRALELLQDIKCRWKRDEEQRLKVVHDEMKRYQSECKQLEEKYHFALESLQRCQSQLTAAEESRQAAETAHREGQGKAKEALDSSRVDAAGLQQRLQRDAADAHHQLELLQTQLAAGQLERQQLQQRLSDAGREQRRLEADLGRSAAEAGRVPDLCAERDRLRAETERLTAAQQQAEARAQRYQQGGSQTAAQLEQELSQQRGRADELSSQLQAARSRARETAASLTAREAEQTTARQAAQAQAAELQAQLEAALADREKLQAELRDTQLKEEDHQQRICELETTLLGLEDSLNKLEQRNETLQLQLNNTSETLTPRDKEELARLQQAHLALETQLERTEKHLEAARERGAVDRHKLSELEDQIRVKDKQVSDWKIDVRIANREARTAEAALEELKKAEVEAGAERTQLQARLTQRETELTTKQAATEAAERAAERGARETEDLKAAHEAEMARWVEQVRRLEAELAEGAALAGRLQELELAKQRLGAQLQDQQAAAAEQKEHQQQLQLDASQLRQQLSDAHKQTQQKEAAVDQLKELCSTLDKQLTDMEAMLKKQEAESQKHDQAKASMADDVVRLQTEVRQARSAANEEKSLKLFQEKRAQELERRLKEQEAEVETERDILRKDLEEYRELSHGLTNQLSEHDHKLSEATTGLRQLERREEQLQAEQTRLKEEASALLTQVHSLKDSNFQLTEALEKTVDRAEGFKERITELESVISEIQIGHEESEKRWEGTVGQQTKLIDFLQAKSEAPPKRKTLADRLFGEKAQKENATPVPMRYRDLERLLERERMRTKQANDQLNRARAEIVALTNKVTPCPDTPCLGGTPQSRRALRLLAQSPGVQTTPAARQTPAATPTPQRMHHNIPHRFDQGLMTRAAKCAACLGPVRFGRTAARCAECQITAHPKCAAELPRTCGLPAALARHFSDSWQQSDASPPMRRPAPSGPPKPPRQPSPETGPDAGRGWIRVPRAGKSGWERRFLCVEEGRLALYADEPAAGSAVAPLETVDLRSGHVHVDADVALSEVPQLAQRDLPYVFKVGVVQETTCWPARCYQFLCSSLPEKQRWVTLLEEAAPAAGAASPGRDAARAQLLYSADGLDVNCAYLVSDQLLLLGTEDGLHSLCLSDARPERRIKVEGFPPVLMMKPVPTLDQLVFIAGKEHELRVSALNAVRTCAEAASVTAARLDSVLLEGLQSCHLLATGAAQDSGFVCAASSNRVCLFRWSYDLSSYQLVKQFSTQEPCTCLHFTPTSIVIGTDRFFEVDLANFAIEEFLDSSDASLAYIVYGTSQMRSFPVAILAVSEKEYLLCFHELGVFVDQFGSRTRKQDIKWSRLPLAFVFEAPFLYIFHFAAVEVVEIARGSFQDESAVPPAVSRLQMAGARYLATLPGGGGGGGGLLLATSQPGAAQLHRLSVHSEAVEDVSSISSWADTDSATAVEAAPQPDAGSLEFSFTPSVMESLEGGDSLSIGSDLSSMSSGTEQSRRVHFNEMVRVRQHNRPATEVPSGDVKRQRR